MLWRQPLLSQSLQERCLLSHTLQALYHLALQGNLKKIKQQVEHLAETDPTYTAFAKKIQTFVTEFQEEELTLFLQDSLGQTE